MNHLPVVYKAQNNIWMDGDIFSDWFHVLLHLELKTVLKAKNLKKPRLFYY